MTHAMVDDDGPRGHQSREPSLELNCFAQSHIISHRNRREGMGCRRGVIRRQHANMLPTVLVCASDWTIPLAHSESFLQPQGLAAPSEKQTFGSHDKT